MYFPPNYEEIRFFGQDGKYFPIFTEKSHFLKIWGKLRVSFPNFLLIFPSVFVNVMLSTGLTFVYIICVFNFYIGVHRCYKSLAE